MSDFVCMYICVRHACCSRRPEECIGYSGVLDVVSHLGTMPGSSTVALISLNCWATLRDSVNVCCSFKISNFPPKLTTWYLKHKNKAATSMKKKFNKKS